MKPHLQSVIITALKNGDPVRVTAKKTGLSKSTIHRYRSRVKAAFSPFSFSPCKINFGGKREPYYGDELMYGTTPEAIQRRLQHCGPVWVYGC